MEKLSVWFCGLYTTPCLTGLLYGYDTVSISGAIDFLQDKYALSPALQGPVISSSIIGGVGIGESVASYLGTKLSVTVVSAEGLACMCAFAYGKWDCAVHDIGMCRYAIVGTRD